MTPFDKSLAKALAKKITRAEEELTTYLAGHFPTGHRCDVLLHARQKNPTPATIWGAGSDYGGIIAVKIDGAKEYSRCTIRRLPPEQVLNVRPPEPTEGK